MDQDVRAPPYSLWLTSRASTDQAEAFCSSSTGRLLGVSHSIFFLFLSVFLLFIPYLTHSIFYFFSLRSAQSPMLDLPCAAHHRTYRLSLSITITVHERISYDRSRLLLNRALIDIVRYSTYSSITPTQRHTYSTATATESVNERVA